ncbi:hypothetical protein AWB67_07121 [Caballeronia terrestris]|uniref:Uncharacterized protein n=1 Tax=Caballeronia terrestris TaxID=1226301 RepID=A0A158KYE4_9BURK|nr:hypothetical protein AWB67_07121 [Caballeronia terrestris]
MPDANRRKIVCARQEIALEAIGDHAVLVVELDDFPKREADAHHDRAPELPFDERRVDHRTTVMHHGVIEQLAIAGRHVELQRRGMHGVREGRVGGDAALRIRLDPHILRREAARDFERQRHASRHGEWPQVRAERQLRDRDPRAVRLAPRMTVAQDDLAGRSAEHVGGALHEPVTQFPRGQIRGRAAVHERAATGVASADRRHVGVAFDHTHLVDAQAEFTGDHLRDAGVAAATRRRDAREHLHVARRHDANGGRLVSIGKVTGPRAAFRREFEGDSDPDAPLGMACGVSPRLPLPVIEHRQQLLEAARIVAAIHVEPGRQQTRQGVARDEIAPAQFDRIDAGLPRQQIDRALRHKVADLLAVTAYGLPRRLVGDREGALDVAMLDRVDGRKHGRRNERHRPAMTGADDADIDQNAVTPADQPSLLVRRNLEAVVLRTRPREQRLAPFLDPRDRALRQPAEQRNQHFLRMPRHLQPERSAHARRDHPHLRLLHAQGRRSQPAARMRVLEGAGERVALPARIPFGDVAQRFHRRTRRRADRQLAASDVRRTFECGVRIARTNAVAHEQVRVPAGLDHRRTFAQGVVRVRRRRVHLVMDANLGESRLRVVDRTRHERRDRLAEIRRMAERKTSTLQRTAGAFCGQVHGGRHCVAHARRVFARQAGDDAWHGERIGQVDRDDRRARMCAAQNGKMERAFGKEIGAVIDASRHEARRVQARDVLP